MRKTITRSRNGCAECKSKRLKCDEAKPSCSRCARLGIPCPGYQKPLKWTGGPRSPNETRSNRTDHHASPTYQPSKTTTPVAFQVFDDISPDIYSSDLFDQITGFIDTENIGLGCDPLQSSFPFLEAPEENRQTPAPSHLSTPGLQLGDTPSAELWLDTVLNEHKTGSNVVPHGDTSSEQPAGRSRTAISPNLQDHTSILVEYYFKEVCGMMSCYDSRMNPYRTTISNAWSRSSSLYYIVQSMAAACLSEVSPGLAAVGRQFRDQAMSSLSQEIGSGPTHTSSLLALVMLGFSLSWHDASDVGQSEFELLAESMFATDAQRDDLPLAEVQRKVFFYNSFVYWRMLLSFVTDRELPSPAYPPIHPQPTQSLVQHHTRVPHPQTGIGIQVQEILAQVGALVRRERKRIGSRRHTSKQDILEAQAAIQTAEQLHAQLCAIDVPNEASVMDSGDEATPVDHLVKVAEAYRCTGLLQLYRNFPDLLPGNNPLQTTNEVGWLHTPSDTITSTESVDQSVANTVLTNLALHILDTVREIPISSRSRSIQPLLLVSICSELSVTRSFSPSHDIREHLPSVNDLSSSPRFKSPPPSAVDILLARRFVLARLSSFEAVLAAKPIRQMIRLVKETWACMDEQREDVFWMDVMMERGYETLMG